MARIGLLTGLCLMYASTWAQVADTTYLEEVRVYGIPFSAYATGSKTEQIKTGDGVETLSDKLIEQTSLYLKTYGNNQLSTVALRGTTASQTAVLWNGININSPTLGQTDFSLVPLFLFDEVSIRYGTASSLYGTDAIGGSIMLGQREAKFQRGLKASVFQQIGSFGRSGTGVKATYGNERWELRTKAYRAFIRNDFPYTSDAVGYSKKQDHASVWNYGFNQQIHFKISPSQQISADAMVTHNFREIQPTVTNTAASDETLQDDDVRLALKYQHNSRIGFFSFTTAYVNSEQDYFNDETSTVRSEQFTALATVDISVGSKTSIRSGGSLSHFTATSENFENGLSEDRYDIFSSLKHAIRPNWIVNLNLRQSFYAGRYAPFAPTLGTELGIVQKEKEKLTLRLQAARGFRVPTLNDRYWIPGGNSSIKPEDAIHIESGLNWSRKADHTNHTFDLSVFRTWADEMIVWSVDDEGVWTPMNLMKVNIHGAEVKANTSIQVIAWQVNIHAVYSLSLIHI